MTILLNYSTINHQKTKLPSVFACKNYQYFTLESVKALQQTGSKVQSRDIFQKVAISTVYNLYTFLNSAISASIRQQLSTQYIP